MNTKKGMSTLVAVLVCVVVIGGLTFLALKSKNMTNEENTGVQNEIEERLSRSVKAGDVVSVNYTGKLENGTVFDSNVDPRFNHVEPFTFTVGAGDVIAGWDKGLIGMKVGEKKTLVIPPEDAYGPMGVPQAGIPGNATLVFDVELVSINN
jgi:FKBP-type peptidyl-prolyl cis-trans isomerase